MNKPTKVHIDDLAMIHFLPVIFLFLSFFSLWSLHIHTCRIRHLLNRQVQAQQRQTHRPNWVHSAECWMLFDIVLQSVAARKNPIGYWTNSHIITGQDQRVYLRKMCHQMHQQRIYYAAILVSTRPYPHTIEYVFYSACVFLLFISRAQSAVIGVKVKIDGMVSWNFSKRVLPLNASLDA